MPDDKTSAPGGTSLSLISFLSNTDLGPAAKELVTRVFDCVFGIAAPFGKLVHAHVDVGSERVRRRGEVTTEAEITELRAFIASNARERMEFHRVGAIMGKTAPMLEPTSDPNRIDRDWILEFYDAARLVSDDEMQSLFARILAGEANRPGAFQKRCIPFLESLEKEEAQLITRLCSRVVSLDGRPVLAPNSVRGTPEQGVLTSEEMARLMTIGFLQTTGSVWENLHGMPFPNGEATIVYFGEERTFVPKTQQGTHLIYLGERDLTAVGAQLSRIAGAVKIPGYLDELIAAWS